LKILATGTAGRIGRSIYIKLMKDHAVVGFDRLPCSTADIVGDIRDPELMDSALEGVDVIVHTAALHAPHVNSLPDSEFESINVDTTETLFREGQKRGIKHFVFTSTTALYGWAATPDGMAGWVDEQVNPRPKTIYHRTKIGAERRLEELSKEFGLPVTVLQMSRCFPESAEMMAVYRLNRGIDARDVATAHALAIEMRLEGFRRFILSGATPFNKACCRELFCDAASVIREHAPKLASEFDRRGWTLPSRIDRVYDSSAAQRELGWFPKHGYESVLRMLDDEVSEVLPVTQ
jgi:UDP-glucose 4-epimerase